MTEAEWLAEWTRRKDEAVRRAAQDGIFLMLSPDPYWSPWTERALREYAEARRN